MYQKSIKMCIPGCASEAAPCIQLCWQQNLPSILSLATSNDNFQPSGAPRASKPH